MVTQKRAMEISKNPRENVTKTPSGAKLPRVFWSHFPRVFVRQQYMTGDD